MTLYNSKIYTITEICYKMNPTHEFTLQNGSKISYVKYLENNYKVKLQYPTDQPMIRCHIERTNQDVYLVPETCVVTGITDEQKGRNFRGIKDDMFANAQKKAEQTMAFFRAIKKDDTKYKAITDKFKIQVQETPLVVNAYPCKAAEVMGDQKKVFKLEKLQTQRDFSHDFNGPMNSASLNKWAIFYSNYGKREFNQFVQELQNTVKNDFQIKCSKPKCIQIDGRDNDSKNWIDSINQTNHEEGLEFIIVLAPGKKGASPIYDQVKYHCTQVINVPTQVVLTDTIGRAKSLRNILKNIMIQVCAKFGGQPWGLKGLPMLDKPTMIIGIDVVHQVGKDKVSLVGFTATMDRYMAKYFVSSATKANIAKPGKKKKRLVDITFELEPLFQKAILKFKETNKIAPQRIIIYRDSISEGQNDIILRKEVPQLDQAIQKLKDNGVITDSISYIYMVANKKIEQ